MQVKLQHERGIPLTDVPNLLPKRNRKKVHYSTVYRWTQKGARGRVLESTMIGGIRYTTMEALQRFLLPEQKAEVATEAAAIDEVLKREGV